MFLPSQCCPARWRDEAPEPATTSRLPTWPRRRHRRAGGDLRNIEMNYCLPVMTAGLTDLTGSVHSNISPPEAPSDPGSSRGSWRDISHSTAGCRPRSR